MQDKVLVLVNGKGDFGKKFKGTREFHSDSKLDVDLIVDVLRTDFYVECTRFGKLDLNKNYKGWYIVYTSSAERGLSYKGYIEDILLRLKEDGAILVPDFKYFRAHENKSFQEMLRKKFTKEDEATLYSTVIGRFEEFEEKEYNNYPYVVKASSGAGSKGVLLAKDRKELVSAVRRLSKISYHDYTHPLMKDMIYQWPFWNIKRHIYHILRKNHPVQSPLEYRDTNKVIIQEFVEGLSSDFKVLYFVGKYFVLNRKNREHDFRASGSGMFVFPESVEKIADILNFAKAMTEKIQAPMISMDIVREKDCCYLIEFQCINFGPYTLQYADWHFEYEGSNWKKVEEISELEYEIARSVREYIFRIKNSMHENQIRED